MKKIDLTGKRFGRLTVVRRYGTLNGRQSTWLCKCDCGNEKVVTAGHLRQGNTLSCGCLAKETHVESGRKSHIGDRSRKHGDFGTKLYNVWNGMKTRCYNVNHKYYKDYGGRGIKVCDEWQKYIPFKEWAISNGYHEGLSIDRIDVNGNYEPSNCRWIPLSEQGMNKRNNVYYEYKGKRYSVKDIAKMTGLKERTIRGRFERGWSVEKTIKTKKLKNQHT